MEKFYVVLVTNVYSWNRCKTEDASPGNNFTLVKTDDIDRYVWEEQCQVAENHAGWDEEEQEWGDFVESNSHAYYFEYDPALEAHVAHKGYEDERPEHIEWAKKEEIRHLKEKIARSDYEIDEHIKELKRIEIDIREANLGKIVAKAKLEKIENAS